MPELMDFVNLFQYKSLIRIILTRVIRSVKSIDFCLKMPFVLHMSSPSSFHAV